MPNVSLSKLLDEEQAHEATDLTRGLNELPPIFLDIDLSDRRQIW
jgi:hypothetical protein